MKRVHCKEKNEKMTKYEEALKRQLGYNPARNYAAAAGGGKRKVICVLLNLNLKRISYQASIQYRCFWHGASCCFMSEQIIVKRT